MLSTLDVKTMLTFFDILDVKTMLSTLDVKTMLTFYDILDVIQRQCLVLWM